MTKDEWELVIKAVSKAILEKHGEFHPNKLHLGFGEISLPNDPALYFVYIELWEQYHEWRTGSKIIK
jgi:hypothetical protein